MENNPILKIPLHQLELSEELKNVMEILGFHSLSELLDIRTKDLVKMPGVTLNMLYEYITFLEERNLGHLVDAIKKGGGKPATARPKPTHLN